MHNKSLLDTHTQVPAIFILLQLFPVNATCADRNGNLTGVTEVQCQAGFKLKRNLATISVFNMTAAEAASACCSPVSTCSSDSQGTGYLILTVNVGCSQLTNVTGRQALLLM